MKIDTINVSHWYQESCRNYEHLSDKWEIYPSNTFRYCCIFKIDIINVSSYYHITFSCVKNWSSKWDSSRPCSSPSTHDRMCFCLLTSDASVFLMSKRSSPYTFHLALTQLFLDTVRDIAIIASSLLQCVDPFTCVFVEVRVVGITLYKSCQTQTSN